jgi:2-dehydro-3-deoxygluconokinase
MNPRVVTFGEIMLRLSPPEHQRFTQARSFDVIYGGAEANVAVSLANYNIPVDFVTRVPANNIGEACIYFLRQYGVGTGYILRGGERLGIYFLENGAAIRSSNVIYDRTDSAFSTIQRGAIDWKSIFQEATWFHWTGITPALSENAAKVCLEGVNAARQLGLTISCDLNYRVKLWKWGKPASDVMEELVALSDIVISNKEDTEKVFKIQIPRLDVASGNVDAEKYRLVCEQLATRFPKLKMVAITLRGSLSASHNTWSGVLWNMGQFFIGPIIDISNIVDRVGAGDSFVAGLIYGSNQFTNDLQRTLDFAVYASALKHTVFGDFNLVTVAEVEALMAGNISGSVNR